MKNFILRNLKTIAIVMLITFSVPGIIGTVHNIKKHTDKKQKVERSKKKEVGNSVGNSKNSNKNILLPRN